MMYAQVNNNIVNLIGGKEVGLPLPQTYLDKNPNIENIKITMKTQVNIGDYYQWGVFYTPVQWAEINKPIESIELEPTLAELKELNMIQMSAIAELAEMVLEGQK